MNNSTYENAIITFLDILGFKNIVDNSSCEEVSNILRAFEHSNKPASPLPEGGIDPDKPILYIFSDCAIRIRPLERDGNLNHRSGLLWDELMNLVFIQNDLINYSVLLRGAISFGAISTSKGEYLARP